MKITSEQLFMLLEILDDSIAMQMGYDYEFRHNRGIRKQLREKITQSIFSGQDIQVLPEK